MDKLTLDTNILNDWLWAEGKFPSKRHDDNPVQRTKFLSLFSELQRLRDVGVCELGVTTQLYTDHHNTGSKLPEHIEAMIGSYVSLASPSLFIFPLTFPTVFVDEKIFDRLLEDIFPQSKVGDKRYPNNRVDVLQIYAHLVAKQDYFITHDIPVLRRQAVLLKNWDIKILPLEEYVKQKSKS